MREKYNSKASIQKDTVS